MKELSDAQLIERHQAGDSGAFAFLVRRHVKPVYNFVYRFARNSQDAEDIVQEAFVKAWRHIGKYDSAQEFGGWLFAIARNAALDWLRKKRPIAFADLEAATGSNPADALADSGPLPSVLAMQADDVRMLGGLLQRLSPHYREVLALRYKQQLTFNQISVILGKPLHTVKSQSRRALIMLKKLTRAPK